MKKKSLLCLIVATAILTACGNSGDQEVSDMQEGTPTPTVTADTQGSDSTPTPMPSSDERGDGPTNITPTPTEAVGTPTPTPTNTPTPTPTPSPTPSNTPTPTPKPNLTLIPTAVPVSKTGDGRDKSWTEESEIGHLPYYGSGTFLKSYSIDTFDYVELKNVTYSDAESYWQKLKSAGFKADSETKVSGSRLWIYAMDSENIICTLSFEQNVFVIGCGHFVNTGDGRNKYWEDTGFLCQLPYFSAGTFTEYSATDYYDYTFFSGVKAAEADAYVHMLKAAGYEGEHQKSETELLFTGLKDGFSCEFKYDIKSGQARVAAGIPITD